MGAMPPSRGDLGTEFISPLTVHPVDPTPTPDLGTSISTARGSAMTTTPGWDVSGELDDTLPKGNALEMTNPGSQNHAVSGLASNAAPPATPMQAFRDSVGAIPGKWWQSLVDAPSNAAAWVGNNPGKALMAAGTLGTQLYRASQGTPGAPAPPRPPGAPAPAAATPTPAPSNGGVDVGQTPRSPLLQGYDVRRSGGLNIGR